MCLYYICGDWLSTLDVSRASTGIIVNGRISESDRVTSAQRQFIGHGLQRYTKSGRGVLGDSAIEFVRMRLQDRMTAGCSSVFH